jgi:putative FmdB family regulatory protein
MAVYTFNCKSCKITFDYKMSPNDLPLTKCPKCGAEDPPERVWQPINSKVPGGFGKSWIKE